MGSCSPLALPILSPCLPLQAPSALTCTTRPLLLPSGLPSWLTQHNSLPCCILYVVPASCSGQHSDVRVYLLGRFSRDSSKETGTIRLKSVFIWGNQAVCFRASGAATWAFPPLDWPVVPSTREVKNSIFSSLGAFKTFGCNPTPRILNLWTATVSKVSVAMELIDGYF